MMPIDLLFCGIAVFLLLVIGVGFTIIEFSKNN